MGLLLTIFFCIRNYIRAKAKRLNAGKWAFLTFLAVIAGWFAGCMIVVTILLTRYPELIAMVNEPGTGPSEIAPAISERMNPFVAELFLLFCGLGGYLFVRHQLIRKPAAAGGDENGPAEI